MRVEVPAEEVSAEREKIVTAFSRQAKIPGFRAGKVPRGVIEKRFAENIEEELVQRLVRRGCQDGFKQEELEVLNVSEVSESSLNDDGTFSFIVHFSLSPEIPLPDFKGIPVELPVVQVTEENIDNSLQRVREKVADFEDVERRGAAAGDFVVIDYKGNIDEAPIAEAVPKAAAYLAQGADAWIEIAEEGFLPGFALQLVGSAKGETRKVMVRFPKDFDVFELQGVEANYEVTVKEIKRRNLPEVDDAFCEKMFEGRNLGEVREWIRENIQEQMERRIDEMKTSQILEFLHKNSQFELPKDTVERQAQILVDQMVERGQVQGLSDEEILQHRDEILGNASQQAQLDVKTRFLLIEIARKEGFTVSQRELSMHVSALAQRRKVPPKKMAKQMKQNGTLNALNEQILASKALDFLKSDASVTLVERDAVPEPAPGTESSIPETNNDA